MMARSSNAPSTGRIQKRKTNVLQIIIFGLQRAAGPYRWVTCGRRPGKSYFDADAALVGCGHVSGLLMRQVRPLALMLCADRVPIVNTHF
jgi:hypothetical protein